MPVYIHCPHCEYPAVLREAVEGRKFRCRQCAGLFTLRLPERSHEPETPAEETARPRFPKPVGNVV